ncbi:hypothetical protein Ancab_008527 [Ancistrocladus abbreviatus]
MSVPINNNQPQVAASAVAASSSSCSSWRKNCHIKVPLALLPMSTAPSSDTSKVEQESDEDLFTVPDVEAQPAAQPLVDATKVGLQGGLNGCPDGPAKRRRGRNPADKEYRRLKRLLRNRVSAQQARERKKVYVNDLESRAKELQEKNFKLEEKISTLLNENTMLRKILRNIRPKGNESAELKHDSG